MRLSRLAIKNFRNYEQAEISFNSDLVLILGSNAAGKTNLLESVYYFSRLRSFRSPDELVARTGTEHFQLRGDYGGQRLEIIVQVHPSTKRVLRTNDVKIQRGFWRAFPVVLFVPSDLNLFSLGPNFRRRFFDETLSQKDQQYALHLQSLDHILKQKSALLQALREGVGKPSDLDFWNEQLAVPAAFISAARREFSQFISNQINSMNEKLMALPSQLVFEYQTQVGNQNELLEKLQSHRDAEIRSGTNLIGPHRDDFEIKKNSILNIHNSSRGELRTQILGLKLLQAEYLSGLVRPIILLDDVFSELDEIRRRQLLENLSAFQVLITSTEERHLPETARTTQIITVADNRLNSQPDLAGV